jgi:hypothetical protein
MQRPVHRDRTQRFLDVRRRLRCAGVCSLAARALIRRRPARAALAEPAAFRPFAAKPAKQRRDGYAPLPQADTDDYERGSGDTEEPVEVSARLQSRAPVLPPEWTDGVDEIRRVLRESRAQMDELARAHADHSASLLLFFCSALLRAAHLTEGATRSCSPLHR